MSLTARAVNLVKSLAKRGDLMAQIAVSEGIAQTVTITTPAAKHDDAIVLSTLANAADALVVAASPAYPRNLIVNFAASWDGGTVTVTGTNQFGTPISEAFAYGSGDVVGTKIFKTVTAASKASAGTGSYAVKIGTGDKLAVGTVKLANPSVTCTIAGVSEVITVDVTYSAFTPTNLANAARTYVLLAHG
jgi:hypothetical protein